MARDPAYAKVLLYEGIDTMLAGDVDTGNAILRDYINATIGFESYWNAIKEPDAHVLSARQPAGEKLVQCDTAFAGVRRIGTAWGC